LGLLSEKSCLGICTHSPFVTFRYEHPTADKKLYTKQLNRSLTRKRVLYIGEPERTLVNTDKCFSEANYVGTEQKNSNLLKLLEGDKFTWFLGMIHKRKCSEITFILVHTIGSGRTGCEGIPAIGFVG